MIKRGPKPTVFVLVVFAYALFVPIVPFHNFYHVDPNNSSALREILHAGLLYFNAFTRPADVTIASANIGVWGQESIIAYFLNFGVKSSCVCAFNPAYDSVNGIGLLPLTVLTTALVVMGLAFLTKF